MAKRKNPRISINKLSEYCIVNPTRRKTIVEQAKNPPAYISTRYSEARSGICEFMLTGDFDVISNTIALLREKEVTSKHAQNDIDCSLQALDVISKADLSAFDGYELYKFEGPNVLVEIAGVKVSVYPDLVVTADKGSQIGTVKTHISKGGLEEESLNIVAAFLYQYTEDFIVADWQSANRNCCFAFDLFSGQIVNAPKSIKQRMKRVESACEEIALRWDSI